MKFLSLALLLPLTLLLSCDPAPASAPDAPVTELGPNASIIRMPVDGIEANTGAAAQLAAAQTEHDFGTVRAGAVIRHTFAFTNEGGAPLLITDARSTCGCTVADYPAEPIAPGERGEIAVSFDTKNKSGYQRKPVVITANTYPSETTLFVSGTVTDQ